MTNRELYNLLLLDLASLQLNSEDGVTMAADEVPSFKVKMATVHFHTLTEQIVYSTIHTL